MEKSEVIQKVICTLWWSENIRFYIFTSENINLYIIYQQYFPVFHYFVYTIKERIYVGHLGSLKESNDLKCPTQFQSVHNMIKYKTSFCAGTAETKLKY